MSLLRLVRIAILLTVLLIVAANHWLGKSQLAGWRQPVWITIYPVNADSGVNTRQYTGQLSAAAFDDIVEFLSRESSRLGRSLYEPVHFQLAPSMDLVPPAAPMNGNRLAIAWWSLKMRWWAWRRGREDGLPEPDIQIFVLYRQGTESVALDRSLGMQTGRYAVVNAFAARGQAHQNRVVMAHELLHVLGATDKYDLQTGLPTAPQGLANPALTPLYPQSRAEIMGARIAISPASARMPGSLRDCVVGPETAREIGWLSGAAPE